MGVEAEDEDAEDHSVVGDPAPKLGEAEAKPPSFCLTQRRKKRKEKKRNEKKRKEEKSKEKSNI